MPEFCRGIVSARWVSARWESGQWLPLDEAAIFYVPGFLAPAGADLLGNDLMASTDWRQHQITLFGHHVPEPRLTVWYADPGVDYSYSGRSCSARPWPQCLQQLRQQLQRGLAVPFNGLLGNLYRDGNDYMGWHSDDEASLGATPVIASISLGVERDFVLRRKDDKRCQHSISLAHGSLLLMAGQTQRYWQHALPKRKRVTQARINLTFRQIIGQQVICRQII